MTVVYFLDTRLGNVKSTRKPNKKYVLNIYDIRKKIKKLQICFTLQKTNLSTRNCEAHSGNCL